MSRCWCVFSAKHVDFFIREKLIRVDVGGFKRKDRKVELRLSLEGIGG